MIKRLAVLNFLSAIAVIVISAIAQMGYLNGRTIGEVSHNYQNLFTPADYAFSIWGIIYIAILAFSVFMLYQAFYQKKYTGFIRNTSFWFIIANIGNILWVFAWLYDFIGMSVILMFLILMKLLKIILNNRMELDDKPIQVIAFYWWPICLYSGWITVATIANMAAFLTESDWDIRFFSAEEWTIIMIIIAAFINITITYIRNMREFAAVGVWALFAIYMRHSGSEELIANTALAAAILVFLNIAYHGFINRKTNPMYRLMNGEKL